MDADQTIRLLLDGNARFAKGRRAAHDFVARRLELLEGQHPVATVVTCSDSRVVPEFIFDVNLGDVFDVESAGNVVDDVGLGTIEYGVEHLETPVLMILGHTRCGAVTACCQGGHGEQPGRLSSVLDRIEGAARATDRVIDRAIEENMRRVRDYVLRESAIVRARAERGLLRVVLAKYVMETGEVKLLD